MENKKLNVGPYMDNNSKRNETKELLQKELKILQQLKQERLAREQERISFEYEAPKVGPYMPETYQMFMPEDDTYITKAR